MSFLETVSSPEDVKKLSIEDLESLCGELRSRILESVSRNGGHLASNLGTVELTTALHYVFDLRRTPFLFDVGHQSYAHKLLTGRGKAFEKLRQCDGCSGFPAPWESPCDTNVSGHSGVAISAALGIGAARTLAGNPDKVIAIVGDGSMGNGISFEALNASSTGGKNLLVILNDNRMSISPAVGSLRRRLNRLITGNSYNRFRSSVRSFVQALPRLHRIARHLDSVIKSALLPPGALFEEFGFRFFGPVNGHNLPELIATLQRLKSLEGPLLLHVVTTKGKGAAYAEKEPTLYHGVGPFSLQDGKLPPHKPGFSEAFGAWMCRQAEKDPKLAAISASMLPGVGLAEFAKRYPKRCFDTGIAEEHAVAFSAGLALAGMHPVCALYATFAQRALDCIYHDAALGNVPVLFVLDRAGAVPDGPTHHGIYDTAFLRGLPNLLLMEPRDSEELGLMLDYASSCGKPAVIRYPRGGAEPCPFPSSAPIVPGKAQILKKAEKGPVLWAIGAECITAMKTAELLAQRDIHATVINARFLSPFDVELARTFASRRNYSIEDNRVQGGLGSALAEIFAECPGTFLHAFGWEEKVISHGNVSTLRQQAGLTPEQIAKVIEEREKSC